ncbi:MAG: hypothetical protein ACRDTU_20185, partial [Micromonosporaceae bacterium]
TPASQESDAPEASVESVAAPSEADALRDSEDGAVPGDTTQADPRTWLRAIAEHPADGEVMPFAGAIDVAAGTVTTPEGPRDIDDITTGVVGAVPPGSWVVFTGDGRSVAGVEGFAARVATGLPAGYRVVVPLGAVGVVDGRLVSGRRTDTDQADPNQIDTSDDQHGFLQVTRDGVATRIGNVLTLRGDGYHDHWLLLRPWQRLATPTPRELRQALWHARTRHAGAASRDIFGAYQRRPAPGFLSGFTYGWLAGDPTVVPDFLRKLSLTRPAPSIAELRQLVSRPEMVASGRYDGPLGRRWAPNRGRDELADVLTAPKVRHTIWLGSPMTAPESRANLVDAAVELGENGLAVLWTDLTRTEVEQAELWADPSLADVEPAGSHPDMPRWRAVAEFIAWARTNRVVVIDRSEVFNRDAPMTNPEVVEAEVSLRRGFGYAAASNVLRMEIMALLGGGYFDHDEPSTDLVSTLASVLTREPGYAFHGRNTSRGMRPGTAILLGTAGHGIWRTYLSAIAERYEIPDRRRFAAGHHTANHGEHILNNLASPDDIFVYRSAGGTLLDGIATGLGHRSEKDLPLVDRPAHYTGSWRGNVPGPQDARAVLPTMITAIQTLVRRLTDRGGDLHWTEMSSLASLPAEFRDQAMTEVLRFVAADPRLREQIRTLTDTRLVKEHTSGTRSEFRAEPAPLPVDQNRLIRYHDAEEVFDQPLAPAGTAIQWWLAERLHPAGLWPSSHPAGGTPRAEPSFGAGPWLMLNYPDRANENPPAHDVAVVEVFHRLIPLPVDRRTPDSEDLDALAEAVGLVTDELDEATLAGAREDLLRVVDLAVEIFGHQAGDPGVTGVDQLWNVHAGMEIIVNQYGADLGEVTVADWDQLVRDAFTFDEGAEVTPEQRRGLVDVIGAADEAVASDPFPELDDLQLITVMRRTTAEQGPRLVDEARTEQGELLQLVRDTLAAPPEGVHPLAWRGRLVDILAQGRDLLADLETLSEHGSLEEEVLRTISHADLKALVQRLTAPPVPAQARPPRPRVVPLPESPSVVSHTEGELRDLVAQVVRDVPPTDDNCVELLLAVRDRLYSDGGVRGDRAVDDLADTRRGREQFGSTTGWPRPESLRDVVTAVNDAVGRTGFLHLRRANEVGHAVVLHRADRELLVLDPANAENPVTAVSSAEEVLALYPAAFVAQALVTDDSGAVLPEAFPRVAQSTSAVDALTDPPGTRLGTFKHPGKKPPRVKTVGLTRPGSAPQSGPSSPVGRVRTQSVPALRVTTSTPGSPTSPASPSSPESDTIGSPTTAPDPQHVVPVGTPRALGGLAEVYAQLSQQVPRKYLPSLKDVEARLVAGFAGLSEDGLRLTFGSGKRAYEVLVRVELSNQRQADSSATVGRHLTTAKQDTVTAQMQDTLSSSVSGTLSGPLGLAAGVADTSIVPDVKLGATRTAAVTTGHAMSVQQLSDSWDPSFLRAWDAKWHATVTGKPRRNVWGRVKAWSLATVRRQAGAAEPAPITVDGEVTLWTAHQYLYGAPKAKPRVAGPQTLPKHVAVEKLTGNQRLFEQAVHLIGPDNVTPGSTPRTELLRFFRDNNQALKLPGAVRPARPGAADQPGDPGGAELLVTDTDGRALGVLRQHTVMSDWQRVGLATNKAYLESGHQVTGKMTGSGASADQVALGLTVGLTLKGFLGALGARFTRDTKDTVTWGGAAVGYRAGRYAGHTLGYRAKTSTTLTWV